MDFPMKISWNFNKKGKNDNNLQFHISREFNLNEDKIIERNLPDEEKHNFQQELNDLGNPIGIELHCINRKISEIPKLLKKYSGYYKKYSEEVKSE